MTGYDVKKLIADSETLPWTANNNQIYQALVELHNDGWVTKNIEEQVGSPNRHVYTITEGGYSSFAGQGHKRAGSAADQEALPAPTYVGRQPQRAGNGRPA